MSIDATNTYNAITVSIPEENITVKVSGGLRGPVGFEYKGTYAAGTTYYHTNVVTYANALYISNETSPGAGHAGNDPSAGGYWTEIMPSSGVFSTIASQAEAEAGVINDEGMTPLRTEQWGVYHLANGPAIVGGTVDNATLGGTTTVTINDITVTLGSDADGDTWYRSSNKLTRLAKGTAYQVYQMNSGATAPEWTSTLTSLELTTPSIEHTVNAISTTPSDVVEGVNLVTCSAADITVTLPTAANGDGNIIHIKKLDATAYNVIVDGDGAETIDGSATVTLTTQYQVLTVVSDGTSWHII